MKSALPKLLAFILISAPLFTRKQAIASCHLVTAASSIILQTPAFTLTSAPLSTRNRTIALCPLAAAI
jgi:hypothetical protein